MTGEMPPDDSETFRSLTASLEMPLFPTTPMSAHSPPEHRDAISRELYSGDQRSSLEDKQFRDMMSYQLLQVLEENGGSMDPDELCAATAVKTSYTMEAVQYVFPYFVGRNSVGMNLTAKHVAIKTDENASDDWFGLD